MSDQPAALDAETVLNLRDRALMARRDALRPVLIVLHQETSTPGRVGNALRAMGYPLDVRRPRFGDSLPATLAGHAGVVVFGGPMSANDPDDYIKREIFDPLGMSTSSFRLTADDAGRLARGYSGSDPESVGFPRIYLRPAGNMHSSPREMAQLVRMLLGWGEISSTFVIDPEYLGSMEQPRTSTASRAA